MTLIFFRERDNYVTGEILGIFRRQGKYLKWLSGDNTEKSKMRRIAGQLEGKYQYITVLKHQW